MTGEQLLDRVVTGLEALAEAGRPYGGMFPSAIDPRTGRMLPELPPPIAGQRHGDRCLRGSNLMHDHVTLLTCYQLASALNCSALADTADRYLDTFMRECTGSVSGLFPWGEHAFWDLERGVPGMGPLNADPPEPRTEGIHDHLLQAPRWLWEKLIARDQAAVERFVLGLGNHFVDPGMEGDPGAWEYNRHAYIDRNEPFKRGADRACDFPRHAGFYVVDLAMAWTAGRSESVRRLLEVFARYHLPYRDADGLVLFVSRHASANWANDGTNAVAQTLSLGVSLLEAAKVLADTDAEFAEELRRNGRAYVAGFLSAPHVPERGEVIANAARSTPAGASMLAILGSRYGDHIAALPALHCLAAYRLTGEARLLDFATYVGEYYADAEFPADVPVPAKDAGVVLELFCDLAELTEDERWAIRARDRADEFAALYLDTDLPRGAASAGGEYSIDYYESQHLPGYLLHGLARTALLDSGPSNPIGADYTLR